MPSINHTHQLNGSIRPYTPENPGKYSSSKAVPFSSVAGKQALITSTPLTLREIDDEDIEQQDENKPVTPQANLGDRNGNATTSDSKVAVAENGGKMTEQETCYNEDDMHNKPADLAEGEERKLPELPKMASALNLVDHSTASSSAITSINRVMAKAYKFPLMEQKPLRFPSIVTAPVIPPRVIPPSAVPCLKLDPFQYSSPQAMPVSAPAGLNKTHIHHSLAPFRPKLSHVKFNQAEIVKQFTCSYKKLYSSPDMRKVIMKKSKRHEFFGHHSYDYH